ncbi:MAG TPA: dihydrofolate reductase family protein [Chitinophagaceae bacterium]|nr:dihydrofolate reductase family protein [Chitinophagaceae bacterium]
MRNIVYYVAVSLDGFIAGPEDDISGFVTGGPAVDQYLNDLKAFDTAIMGRKTYEFGYKFGLKPGGPAYPHMKHYIFSNSLQLDKRAATIVIHPIDINIIKKLKAENSSDIYLCGGGEFAGWLLDNEMIDFLKIKLNPLILGSGIKLFGSSKKKISTELVDIKSYNQGLQIINYRLNYKRDG